MSTEFTAVDFSSMQQGITDINTAYTSTAETLSTLEEQLGKSLAQWEGSARLAYTDAQRTWDQAAAHMNRVINTMKVTLASIDATYKANEAKNTGRWEG